MTGKKADSTLPLILIVDDDVTIRILARESLEQEGFRVEEAEDGLDGLRIFKQTQPNIVLLDVIMPLMDGFDVCDSIRKLPGGDLIPVLMMTGKDDRESINSAYEAGATDFITKPINWVILRNRVRYMLRASQTLKNLSNSETKNRALLDAIPDLMFQITRDGTFIDCKVAKNIELIMDQSEFLNKRLFDVLPEELARQTLYHIECAFKTGGVQCFDYQLEYNGEIHFYEARIVVSGKDEVVSLIRETTEQKRAEEEKKRLEEQLQQAQKMKAIGTLAGGIAHDFNNLLMGIQGHASLMSINLDPDHPHFERVQDIENIVKKGANLTKQLLNFAKGGKYEIRPVYLNDLIEKSIQMFSRTKKEIRIHKKYQEDIWTVEVDQDQIDQVLLNLYINAWQAMPGGGDLYIETKNIIVDKRSFKSFDLAPGNYVKVTVTDTGVGMDDETKSRIFEPFFTTKQMGRGTGLGLASVYGIIKNHGGAIDVFSEKGKGTTFNCYFPVSKKVVEEEEKELPKLIKGRGTILLVDDEEMILNVGESMLSFLGYNVLSTISGKEAIKIYKENIEKIDMVILDVIMPEISGIEIYDRLKELNPDIKVLLSTGYSMNNDFSKILSNGCNGFIQKPFSLNQISQSIRGIFDRIQ